MGSLDTPQRSKKTHVCISCQYPIAVYGRCAPCLHVFCLTCAADMPACRICGASITKLERIPAGTPVFVSPATLQGYRSEADLERHARELQRQFSLLMGGAHPLLQQMQAQAMRGGQAGQQGSQQGPGLQQMQFRRPAAAHAQMQLQMQQQQQVMMAAYMQQQAAIAAAQQAQQGLMPGPVTLRPGQQQQQQF